MGKAGPFIYLFLTGMFMVSCRTPLEREPGSETKIIETSGAKLVKSGPLFGIRVSRDIPVKNYFRTLDSIVSEYRSRVPYALSEHLLVHANPWIIDSLQTTDYYHQKQRGIFVYDQRQLTVLHEGDSLFIPDSATAALIQNRLNQNWIDINIPEFSLRLYEKDQVIHCMNIRVGQNTQRYQAVPGRFEDLRTIPGEGRIVRINREPTVFFDPHTGIKHTHTTRDDGKSTLMPLIPWLEPEINGQRPGQLLHPTTNPKTLGKAYSNGCIAFSEGEAWLLYYHASVGTRIVVRYDLKIVNDGGDTVILPDIYNFFN